MIVLRKTLHRGLDECLGKEETLQLFRPILGYAHLFSRFLIVFWFFSDTQLQIQGNQEF